MVESDQLDRCAVQEHVGRYTWLCGGLGWRRRQFGLARRLLIVDGKVHLAGVADRRDQFVVEPCRSRPYKEVGGSSVLEGLDEDLVLAAFYLERLRRTYCNRGHRLSDLNDGQVVQRRLNSDDPVARWRFRVNLLAGSAKATVRKLTRMRLILLGLPSKKPPGEGPLSRYSPGDWLLHLRTRERPCFPWPYRGAFNKRLPLGWRIKLVDARRISVHEHRETLAIPFHASRDEPLPVVRATQALAEFESSGAVAGSRTSPSHSGSRLILPEWQSVAPNRSERRRE